MTWKPIKKKRTARSDGQAPCGAAAGVAETRSGAGTVAGEKPAADAAAEACEGLAAGSLAWGLTDAAALQAAATSTTAMSGAIRASTLRFEIIEP